jgi:hypothetical protein
MSGRASCTPMSSKQIELQVASHRRSSAQQACQRPHMQPLWHIARVMSRNPACVWNTPCNRSLDNSCRHSYPSESIHLVTTLAFTCLHRWDTAGSEHSSVPSRPFALAKPNSKSGLYALRPIYAGEFSLRAYSDRTMSQLWVHFRKILRA